MFAEYHIQLPPGDVPAVVKLPPKSELREAIQAISLGKEFRTESAALMAAATYAWFHVIFSGYRFGLARPRKKKSGKDRKSSH